MGLVHPWSVRGQRVGAEFRDSPDCHRESHRTGGQEQPRLCEAGPREPGPQCRRDSGSSTLQAWGVQRLQWSPDQQGLSTPQSCQTGRTLLNFAIPKGKNIFLHACSSALELVIFLPRFSSLATVPTAIPMMATGKTCPKAPPGVNPSLTTG